MQATAERARQRFGLAAPSVDRPRKGRRSDSLPEYSRYQDDGCDIHDRCLTCPLPRCRYEEPGGLRGLLNELRDREIVQLRTKGVSVNELAGKFGVSRRTVFRILGSQKAARHDTTIALLPAALAERAQAGRRAAQRTGNKREESPFGPSTLRQDQGSGLRTQRCA